MFNDILKSFLELKKLQETDEIILIKEIKKTVYFAVQPLKGSRLFELYSKEHLENEILNDIFIKLIKKRNVILPKINNTNNIKSYIKFLAVNHIKDKLKTHFLDQKEMNYTTYSTTQPTLKTEAEEFIDFTKKQLSKKEKEALCLELLNTKPNKNIKTAYEKAKSRAKQRLKNIAVTYKFSKDCVEYAVENLFLSEICKDFVNNIEVKNENT